MGDKSLMRKLILIFTLSLFSYSSSLSYDEIAKMVEKIKQKREGIGVDELDDTPNPFTIIKKVVKKPKKKIVKKKPKKKIIKIIEPTYTLTAILNSRAFINGKWYATGDKIGDYKVAYIGDSIAILKSQRATKRLKIEPQIKKINLFGGGDKR